MKTPSGPVRAVVVGGGLAGLAAAHRLHRSGAQTVLLEAGDRVGGVVRTIRHDGFLVDLGPNTLVDRGRHLGEVVSEAGLDERVVRPEASVLTRFVVRQGRLIPLPAGPGALLRSGLFSAMGKARMLTGLLAPGAPPGRRESVASFVRRRLGPEALEYVVDPFISGIFAGDPERLVLRQAFPMAARMAAESRSLLLGGFRVSRQSRSTTGVSRDRRPFSFVGGMEELPAALAAPLQGIIRVGSRVSSIDSTHEGYSVTYATVSGDEKLAADVVVVALPPGALAGLPIVAPSASSLVQGIPTPPVAVLGLGFRRDQVEHPLDGFGFLVPGSEPYRTLGALFSSSMFPDRAPPGHELLTCFLGGRRRPNDALASEDDQLEILLGDLSALLGVRGDPVAVVRHVWPAAIPQYEDRHADLVDALAGLEAAHPGLAVAGSIVGGISVGDVLQRGRLTADRALQNARTDHAEASGPPSARY